MPPYLASGVGLAWTVANGDSDVRRPYNVKALERVGNHVSSDVVASLLLLAMPGAPSSVLAPSSDARSPS